MYIEIELQKFPCGKEARYRRSRQYVTDLSGIGDSGCAACIENEGSRIGRQIAVEYIEKGSLSGTVTAEKSVDLSALKGKACALEYFFLIKALSK